MRCEAGHTNKHGKSKVIELRDRLKLDICHFNHYLLCNTSFVVSLARARDHFALLAPSGYPTVKILGASFYVRQQSIILPHQKLLESGNNTGKFF